MRIGDWSSDVCSSDLLRNRQPGTGRRIGHAQGEVAAQRIAGKAEPMGREPAGDFTDRQHHLIESAGMEDIRIQMMGFAVVAKIEAKYLKAALQQGGCGMQHVTGIGTDRKSTR